MFDNRAVGMFDNRAGVRGGGLTKMVTASFNVPITAKVSALVSEMSRNSHKICTHSSNQGADTAPLFFFLFLFFPSPPHLVMLAYLFVSLVAADI